MEKGRKNIVDRSNRKGTTEEIRRPLSAVISSVYKVFIKTYYRSGMTMFMPV